MKIHPLWKSSDSSIDKDTYEKLVRSKLAGNDPAFNRLREIINNRLTVVSNAEISTEEYDSPSWSSKQAHRNGQRQELEFLLKLMTKEKE